MEITAWFSLATICLMGAMTPGPSAAIVLKNTLNGGRANGLATGLALGLGIALYAAVSIAGLALLIQQSPQAFAVIRWVSVGFILYLAYGAFTGSSTMMRFDNPTKAPSLRRSFADGMMITLINPKLAIFFIALFSQFIHADAPWWHNVLLIATVASIETLWYSLMTLVIARPAMLDKLRRNGHIVGRITGFALLSLALRVIS